MRPSSFEGPWLVADGVVALHPLRVDDVEVHEAGQDAELIRWLSGGAASYERQLQWLEEQAHACATGAPVVDVGVHHLDLDALVGTVGLQSAMTYLSPGQVNISYGLYPAHRGRGLATRAVLLGMRLAASWWPVREFVIRVDPANTPSVAVAVRCGFTLSRATSDEHGHLDWYTRAADA